MKNLKYILTSLFLVLILTNVKSNSLNNNKLSVGVIDSPPFVIFGKGNVTGITVDLWKAVADSLKLDYHFVIASSMNAVADVAETNVNLSVAPMDVNSKNIDKTFFSQPFFITSLSVVVENQSEPAIVSFFENLFSFAFLRTIGLLLLINLVIGIMMWIVEYKKNDSQFPNNLSGIGDGFWWSWVTMTTVGYGDKVPQSGFGRILGIIWMFTAVIIISGFTASITTELTTKRLANQVNNFTDLHNMKVGCVANSNTAYFLDYKDITSRQYPSVAAGIDALQKGEITAFVGEDVILNYFVNHRDMGFTKKIAIIDFPNNKEYHCFSSPDAELINKINYYLMRIIESDEWGRMLKKYGVKY